MLLSATLKISNTQNLWTLSGMVKYLGYDSHSVSLHMIQEINSIESTIQYL